MKKNLLFLLSLMLCSTLAWAQKSVTGKVTGDDGIPLPGVNVRVKNSQVGVSTDAKGAYSIQTNAQDVLLFSSVGYASQEVKVGNRTEINVALLSGASSLDEVVVIGYGTQKKASLTGAVASVTSKELLALPVPSIESALQGRVSGVQVTNNGSPGVAPVVRVRGIGSINYAANP